MSAEITVKGNLGSDPELKFVQGSKGDLALATFSLAYTPRSKQGNEWVDGETLWFRVTQFGEKAETLIDALRKGDTVVVVGSLKQSTFKAKDGTDKTSLEINASDIGVVPKAKKRQDTPSW